MTLRNRLFAVSFFLFTAFCAIFGLPALLMPRGATFAVARVWASGIMILLRWVAGIRFEIRGQENLPSGPCIVAAKHQSPWDTFVLNFIFFDPCIVLKRELLSLPLFGLYLKRGGAIPLDRDAAAMAMRQLINSAKAEIAKGRLLVIFPEGTRVAPGEKGIYKPGVAGLYNQLKIPAVPVALNSGLHWPAKGWNLKPGRIVWEFLPPIQPGLSKSEFLARLEQDIETGSNALLQAGG